MASLYTDEAREKRYERLRLQSELCERGFKWLPRITAGLLIIAWFAVFMIEKEVSSDGQIMMILAGVLGCIGLLFRHWIPAGISVLAMLFVTFAFFGELHGLSLLPLAALGAALAICVKWAKLKKEEGYPYFKIPLSEYEDRRKAQVSIIEHRAVEAGVRAAQEHLNTDRDMDDLLDQTTDAVHAQLHSYHDRSRDADPVVRAAEAHDGTMTKLEDMEEL